MPNIFILPSVTKHIKEKNMTFKEFESKFKEKCKLEAVSIKKFEYLEIEKYIKLELKYSYDTMPIPDRFDINNIDFSNKLVSGIIQEKNFRIVIETFYT